MRATLLARPHSAGRPSKRGAAIHKHMQITLLARSYSAHLWSGSSRNTQTHVTNLAGQTALGMSLVREELQHAACEVDVVAKS